MSTPTNPTACLLVIGNEVLSGRTQDANLRFLATGLGEIGIPLREVRVIHDITSECISAAFGVPWEAHPVAWARMEKSYKPGEFNAARQRMATMPRGASLIDNEISVAPGFTIGNVHVMAGVPRIMQSMFRTLAPTLAGGPPIVARSVYALRLAEGVIAEGLTAIQNRYPGLDLGSYPYYRPSGNGVAIVAKGNNPQAAEAAIAEVTNLMIECGATPIQGEPPEA